MRPSGTYRTGIPDGIDLRMNRTEGSLWQVPSISLEGTSRKSVCFWHGHWSSIPGIVLLVHDYKSNDRHKSEYRLNQSFAKLGLSLSL